MQPQVQLLGIRSFFSKEKQKDITFEAFFERNWRSPSVADLFLNAEQVLEQIPPQERFNLYYTCATCFEEKGRKMVEQSVIPFDVDKIDVARRDEYIPIILTALGLKREETGILFSGNGLQFIVGLKDAFTSVNYFEENRHHYKAVADKIDRALGTAGLPGEADVSVWSPARLMRLPLTLNKKPGKPERLGELINRVITPIAFDLAKLSGIPTVSAQDHINTEVLKRYPKPDSKAILQGCDFLKTCLAEPNQVSEGQWYAMLSITARLEDGNQLSHEYSKGYAGYSHSETESKIEQALKASGPRTCTNINSMSDACKKCRYNGKVTSPIMIQSEDYIKTKDSGFHEITLNKNNNPKPGKPCYEDLRKFFEQQNKYVVLGESRICLVWTGKFWREMKDTYLENFAQSHFRPIAQTHMTQEFKNLVCRTNLRDTAWFVQTTNRKINFNNGVLDLDTMALNPHGPELGFRYVLSYDYDPAAACPRFETFLEEVTGGSKELASVLIEFAGYSFSNDECWAEKALIMTGDGSNGKSTLMNVYKALAGKENYASLTLADLKAETNRQQLDGRLFNLAEETPTYAMAESSLFKNLVTGGETTVKMLYKQPYTIANKCKLMFACNELPKTKDTTRGFFRRLLIVPFKKEFEGAAKDPFLKTKLFQELPGIFNLVIKAYKELYARGRFVEGDTLKQELENYRRELDNVESWYDDHVDDTAPDTCEAQASKMYSSYKFYVEERGEKPEAYTTFCRRLAKLVPNYIKNNRQHRKLVDGRKESVIKGVRFGELRSF